MASLHLSSAEMHLRQANDSDVEAQCHRRGGWWVGRATGIGGDRKAVSKGPEGLKLLPDANQVSNIMEKLINRCM